METTGYRGKKVLVTGHTGFKGAWLSLWLHTLGAQVAGYALDPPTTPNFYTLCNIGHKIQDIRGDIRNLELLRTTIAQIRPEIVFHCAAQSLVRRSYQNPVETFSVNLMGSVHIMEACRSLDTIEALIVITSDKCYRPSCQQQRSCEEDPLGGVDPYSASKACAELAAASYAASFSCGSFPIATARAGNVIGGGDWAEDRLIPDCIRALCSEQSLKIRYPNAVRPWQHVLEALSGYLLLGSKIREDKNAFAGAWNFGPEETRSVEWIVTRIFRIWGKGSWEKERSPFSPESSFLALDSKKARTKLGWHPVWKTEKALEKSVEWYLAFQKGCDMENFSLRQIKEYENSLQKSRGKKKP